MPDAVTIHATCVAIDGRGVLILGPPGSGKSSLALRLIDTPGFGVSGVLKSALLVADDQVEIKRKNGLLLASAPANLAGKIEIRGLGIVPLRAVDSSEVSLAVRLAPASAIERMPEPDQSVIELLGVTLPLMLVDGESAVAPSRVRAALDQL